MSTRDKVRSVVVEALARSWSDEREHEPAPEMIADAILAAFPILRDELPDEVVEAAARALQRRADASALLRAQGSAWGVTPSHRQDMHRGEARTALDAARAVRDA